MFIKNKNRTFHADENGFTRSESSQKRTLANSLGNRFKIVYFKYKPCPSIDLNRRIPLPNTYVNIVISVSHTRTIFTSLTFSQSIGIWISNAYNKTNFFKRHFPLTIKITNGFDSTPPEWMQIIKINIQVVPHNSRYTRAFLIPQTWRLLAHQI